MDTEFLAEKLAQGGSVRIPHGNYVFSGDLFILPNSSVDLDDSTLTGEGPDSRIKITGVQSHLFNGSLVNSHVRASGTSSDSSVKGLRISNETTYGVLVDNVSGISSGLDVRDCAIESQYPLVVWDSKGSSFRDLSLSSSVRGVKIVSAERCSFNRIIIDGAGTELPIVGLLNISDREVSTTGFIDNNYTDIQVNGWLEEGFSFDCYGNDQSRTSVLGIATIASALDNFVTLSVYGEYNGFMLVFHTGALVGKKFNIVASSDDVYELEASVAGAQVGDIVSIELRCYGNTLDNVRVVSDVDKTGFMFWGMGYGTSMQRCETVRSMLNIRGLYGVQLGGNEIAVPHNISVTEQKSENANLYSNYDILVNPARYNSAPVYPLHGLSIINPRVDNIKIGGVSSFSLIYRYTDQLE